MDAQEFAERLSAAMNDAGVGQQAVADATGRTTRTIRNWLKGTGKSLPTPADRAALRELFGPFDAPGDPVERAVLRSELTEDRQYEVIGFYKRKLREQRDEFPVSP